MLTPNPLFLIPIKAFTNTKSRLRAALSSQYSQIIEDLVITAFYNLLKILKSLSYPFGIISPSQPIIDKCKQMGAIFTFKDAGTNLNQALYDASRLLSRKQQILIIMPDLPFITKDFLILLTKEISNIDVLIIPSISDDDTKGTAILYMKTPILLPFRFGENSSLNFKSDATQRNLKFRILHYEPFARDLDTLNDIKYLKQHLELIRKPEQFAGLLGQIHSH